MLSLIMAAIGCRKTQEEVSNEDTDKLFKGMCQLTQVYIDSMEKSHDSLMIQALMERYDLRVTELNFKVAANTDYALTEGKNDTIALLVDSMRRVFNRKLLGFAHRHISVDSIASDTILKEKI